MRVAVEDGLHVPVRPAEREEPVAVEQVAVGIGGRVVDEEHRRPVGEGGQRRFQPRPLRLPEKPGDLVHVEQRVEDDDAERRVLDHGHVPGPHWGEPAGGLGKRRPEVVAVVVVAEGDVDGRHRDDRSEQGAQLRVVLGPTLEPGHVAADDDAVGPRGHDVWNRLPEALPGIEAAVAVLPVAGHVRVREQRQVQLTARSRGPGGASERHGQPGGPQGRGGEKRASGRHGGHCLPGRAAAATRGARRRLRLA